MVRLSDIFKLPKSIRPQEVKSKEAPAKEAPAESSEQEIHAHIPPKSAFIPKTAHEEQSESEKTTDMHISRAMKETVTDKANYQKLYLTGMQLANMILANADELKPVNLVPVEAWVSEIANCLIFVDVELLRFFYGSSADNYLHSHMVNTVIMAAEVGIGLGFNKSKLNELGLATFLHDIGMIKVADIAQQTKKLTEEEYSEIKNHPVYGEEILSKIKNIPEPIIYVVREEHERANGSGYPKGIKENEISEYARIVAIADVYEALTHDRPYRKKIFPHDAVKELIKNNTLFDSVILKVFVNKVGVYPVSSWLELNTNEVGQVEVNNNENPLRPVVNILFDATGRRLKEPHVINLAKQFNIFIKRPLSDEDLAKELKDPIK